MKKVVKIILAVIVAVAAVAGFAYNILKPLDAELLLIEPRNANMYFIEQGYGVSQNAVEIYPMTSGAILSVSVSEGDYVQKGDVLCTIDPADYKLQIQHSLSIIKAYESQRADIGLQESKEKTALRTNRDDLMAQLSALNAQRQTKTASKSEQTKLQENINKQLKSNYEWAENNLNSAKVLYENNALSKQDYEDALKTADDARKLLEQGEIQLDVINTTGDTTIGSDEYFDAMEQSINTQIAGVDKSISTSYTKAYTNYYTALIEGENTAIAQYEKKISDCTIVSPVSGYVRDLYIKDINVASTTQPVASVSSENVGEIEVYVLTKDLADIQTGDEVELILKRRSKDEVFISNITKIDNKAVDRISALGVNEKKVKVTIAVPEESGISEGFDVDVKFTYYNEANTMIVPKTALFTVGGKDMVWVVRGGKAQMIEVNKGVELRGEQAINSGIVFNDYVVVDANNDKLCEGVSIHGGK